MCITKQKTFFVLITRYKDLWKTKEEHLGYVVSRELSTFMLIRIELMDVSIKHFSASLRHINTCR